MLFYKSYFPNQIHQLNVSISKHLYILKNGNIKYQKKAFDINWKNYHKSEKEHLVHYIIRDHFSNCYYAEICSSSNLMPIEKFIWNAWRQKSFYEFGGIPNCLIYPNTVLANFSEFQRFTGNFVQTKFLAATSGFEGGVRIVREWEEKLTSRIFYFNYFSTIDEIKSNIEQLNRQLNSLDRKNCLKTWKENLNEFNVLSDKDVFLSFFK